MTFLKSADEHRQEHGALLHVFVVSVLVLLGLPLSLLAVSRFFTSLSINFVFESKLVRLQHDFGLLWLLVVLWQHWLDELWLCCTRNELFFDFAVNFCLQFLWQWRHTDNLSIFLAIGLDRTVIWLSSVVDTLLLPSSNSWTSRAMPLSVIAFSSLAPRLRLLDEVAEIDDKIHLPFLSTNCNSWERFRNCSSLQSSISSSSDDGASTVSICSVNFRI